MNLHPEMTLAELAADEQAQRELVELILQRGVRGAMWAERISYDRADAVAEGVRAGVRKAVEEIAHSTDTQTGEI